MVNNNLNKRKFGTYGENRAIEFLKSKNYEIIEQNFFCRQGEIDIIAKDNQELVFIEVKTRNNELYGKAIDSVNNYKQKHIWNAAKYYLYKNNLFNCLIRFDVIEIYIKKNEVYINQIRNIFD